MSIAVGVVFALLVGLFGATSALDRDRAFYPVIMIVIAFYYVLFAVMGGSSQAVWLDAIIAAAFIAAAVVGFRHSLWIVVAALAGHGILDSFHGAVVANPGVPAWWPGFCIGYDIAAAAFLAWRLKGGRVRATP